MQQRPVQIIVPFKLNGAKSRLSPVLTPSERRLLAFAMLRDVLDVVSGFGEVTILSRPGLKRGELCRDARILESDQELNDALNSLIDEQAALGWPSDILIVMADLALLTECVVEGILNCEGDVVLCPGRGGGTNMILMRSPKFRTCYLGLSFPKHLAFAESAGLKVSVFESFRAGSDIDEPEDLAEVLLHGRGEARGLLREEGLFLQEKRGDGMNDDTREWDLLLEGYKSIRTESLNKMDKQYQIMGLGVGGIALLIGIMIQYKIYFLFLLLPIIIVSALFLYHAENCAIINAGNYAKMIETKYIKINEKLAPEEKLGWETWLENHPAKCKAYVVADIAFAVILIILYIFCIAGIFLYLHVPGSGINEAESSNLSLGTESAVANVNDIAVPDAIVKYIPYIGGLYLIMGSLIFGWFITKKCKALRELA